MIIFSIINLFFTPILGIIFCLNLVSIIKKTKQDESTAKNTFWLTLSFVIIIWSLSVGTLFT